MLSLLAVQGRLADMKSARRVVAGWLWVLCTVLWAGCSWIFDDTAPEMPLVGDPPVMERFLKLNQKTARDAFVVYDASDKPWAVIPELPELPAGIPDGVTLPNLPELIRLVRLDPQEDPTTAATYPSQYLQLTLRSLYIMVTPQLLDPQSKDKTVFLSRVRPGQPLELFGQFPEGTPVLLVSSSEQVGVMISQSSKSRALRAFRMDGSMETRDIAIPEGVDPSKPFDKGRYQLDGSGERFIVHPPASWQPQRVLMTAGWFALTLFVIIRGHDGYGNLFMHLEGNTLIDWLHVSKYPPSLVYTLLELGSMAIVLALLMRLESFNKTINPNNPVLVFGQTALFFYLAHFAVLTALKPLFERGSEVQELYFFLFVLLYLVMLRRRIGT